MLTVLNINQGVTSCIMHYTSAMKYDVMKYDVMKYDIMKYDVMKYDEI